MRAIVAGLEEQDAWRLVTSADPLVSEGHVVEQLADLGDALGTVRPDVALVWLGHRPGQALYVVRELVRRFPAVPIIAMAPALTTELVASARDAGCQDLVPTAGGPEAVIQALHDVQRRFARGAGKVISVLGAKGGLGTTTVATNLAAELSTIGLRVCLVDLQLYLGGIAGVLDVGVEPSVLWFLHHQAEITPEDVLAHAPSYRAGMRVLGLSGEVDEAQAVEPGLVEGLLRQLRHAFDAVVVDCGSDLGEPALAALYGADRRLLVVTEDRPACRGARLRARALERLGLGDPAAELVVNRRHAEDLEPLRRAVGLPLAGSVANAWQEVWGALQQRRTLREACPSCAATSDIAAIAATLVEKRREPVLKRFLRRSA